MKITELNIPENHEGLMAATLRGFGQTVYLAGPNGSGKTRVLQFVKWAASVYKQPHEIALLRTQENQFSGLIKSLEADVRALEAKPDSRSPETKAQITSARGKIANYQGNFGKYREQLRLATHLVTESTENPDVVDLSFSNTSLNDPRQQNLSKIEEALKNVQSNVSSSNAATHGLSAVTQVFRQYYAATHPDRQIAFSEHELKARKQDRDTLVNIVRDLAGLDIEPNPNGEDPWIGGKPVTEAKLSSGQIILLIAAMALHFQGGKLNNLVLLLDEPENHLHPGAAAEVIKRIRAACPNGQIWIATHSVHLLAQADANDIWFVKDGQITKGGSKTQEVLCSLLGGEEGQLKLATLLARPAEYAVSYFALQCLSPRGSQTRQQVISKPRRFVMPLLYCLRKSEHVLEFWTMAQVVDDCCQNYMNSPE